MSTAGRQASSSPSAGRRITREIKTVKAMIRIFCRDHHQGTAPCEHCARLQTYAVKRLHACRFQEQKSTCGTCPIHCYQQAMKEKIQQVMRYSGPRMMLHHPILALAHLLDEYRQRRSPNHSTKPYKGDQQS